MMLGRVLPLTVAKEVRALLPVWLGCLALMVAGAAADHGALRDFVMMFYCAGSVGLGALSIGHEYAHGTLPLLLSQPGSRARLFVVKQSVLAVMLLIMAGVASRIVSVPSSVTAGFVVLSALGGLFVAPWVTMVARNPLAGTVFTIVMPGLLWLVVNGFVADQLKLVVFWRGMLGLSAVAAVLSWRGFMRLEAIEGRGADVRWPTAAAGLAPARRRHPIWLLVKKELGLQQLAFAVAGIYLLGWTFTTVLGRTDVRYDDLFGAMTFVNSGLLALLIGSLASAEERHLSTAEWQLLLPMASWKQWMVKAGTALGLAMLLAVALPALLTSLSGGHVRIAEGFACAILLLTAVSLYVSSLSTSGVRALLLSVPVSLFVVFPVIAFVSRLGWVELTLPVVGLFALALAVVLYFALLNHRSAERGVWRICVQVFCIAGCFAFCAVLAAVLKTS
jgi:hypothetical protein